MAANKKLPSVERLREIFDYEPGTGKLTRKVKRGNNGPIGPVGSDGGQGYLYVSLDHGRYLFHRLVWAHHYGEWPTKVIDHIDGNGHNNSIANLRDVSSRENSANMLRNKEMRADAAKWRAHVAALSADSLTVAGGLPVGKIVGYMDPEEDFILPTIDSPVVMGKITLFRSPADKWTKPLYDGPPAQAVDLGPFRSLARSWIVEAGGTVADTKHACADELLALIDSQAVGNG